MKTVLHGLMIIGFCLLMQGCMATTIDMNNIRNTVSSGASKFDNSHFVRMTNIACGDVELELYQDTQKAKSGTILLTAGTRDIENIGRGKSLLFRLDGQKYSFEATSVVTEHNKIDLNMSANIDYSNKSYLVPESFVRKFAASDDVRVKLYLLNNNYVEGFCSPRSYEEYYEATKPEDRKWLTQRSIDMHNEIAATKGFQKFIKAIDEAFN
jgi:hypothetical protein